MLAGLARAAVRPCRLRASAIASTSPCTTTHAAASSTGPCRRTGSGEISTERRRAGEQPRRDLPVAGRVGQGGRVRARCGRARTGQRDRARHPRSGAAPQRRMGAREAGLRRARRTWARWKPRGSSGAHPDRGDRGRRRRDRPAGRVGHRHDQRSRSPEHGCRDRDRPRPGPRRTCAVRAGDASGRAQRPRRARSGVSSRVCGVRCGGRASRARPIAHREGARVAACHACGRRVRRVDLRQPRRRRPRRRADPRGGAALSCALRPAPHGAADGASHCASERGAPEAALCELRAIEPFDLSWQTELEAIYWRGAARLEAGRPADAVAQFRKLLGHWTFRPDSHFLALARVGLARAHAAQGERDLARAEY